MDLCTPFDERFEIEHLIGRGGMGTVFRARDHATGKRVAVKIIHAQAQSVSRFGREVAALAEISHPGVVRYIAHGVTPGGEPFLVMEWLEGEDLEHRLARAPLRPGEAIRLVTRVAEVLGVIHARGIVHRDLKPSNLFLPSGCLDAVKVLDFGIALCEGHTQLTRTGLVLGTVGYMAPEQVRSGRVVDARVDVFALGCVLFQCLTGTTPFVDEAREKLEDVLRKIQLTTAPRLAARWADAPPDLDALLGRILAHDPELRPTNGAHLAAALATLEPVARERDLTLVERARPPAPEDQAPRRLTVVQVAPWASRQLERPAHGGEPEVHPGKMTIVMSHTERRAAAERAATQAALCALAVRAAGGQPLTLSIDRLEPSPIAVDAFSSTLDAQFAVVRGASAAAVAAAPHTPRGRRISCVGRDWELGLLTGVFDACVDEAQSRVVVVTASAGVGKSRLAAELVDRVRVDGPRAAIWTGRGDPRCASVTLGLLSQTLRSALGLAEGTPLPAQHARLRARVAERLPTAEQARVGELLGALLDPMVPDGPGSRALRLAHRSARLMSEDVRAAWLDFLTAETAAQPVLIVLDDLQWSDFSTVRFLEDALRERDDRPWMVLALARPEVVDVFPRLWARCPYVQEVQLRGLGRRASERLVREALGEGIDAGTLQRLVTLADGNAAELEELIGVAAATAAAAEVMVAEQCAGDRRERRRSRSTR